MFVIFYQKKTDSTAYQLLSVGLCPENLRTDLTLMLSLNQDWRLKIDTKQSFASGPSMREWVEHWTSTLDNFWHENHFTRLLTHDESLTSWEDEKYHIYILWHKRKSHLRWNWREVSSLVANRIMSNFCHIEKLLRNSLLDFWIIYSIKSRSLLSFNQK